MEPVACITGLRAQIISKDPDVFISALFQRLALFSASIEGKIASISSQFYFQCNCKYILQEFLSNVTISHWLWWGHLHIFEQIVMARGMWCSDWPDVSHVPTLIQVSNQVYLKYRDQERERRWYPDEIQGASISRRENKCSAV